MYQTQEEDPPLHHQGEEVEVAVEDPLPHHQEEVAEEYHNPHNLHKQQT
jgi:hypothetical protein